MPGGFDVLGLRADDSAVPQSFITEYDLWMPHQSTGLFVADSPRQEGFVTLVCLSAVMIDPAGGPVDSASQQPAADGIPRGMPVDGKPGFITSPWAPDKGQVDVGGIPAGTKVKCPYTGKVFLVP